MDKRRFFGLLITLVFWGYLPTQALHESLPTPSDSPNQLFYLQRSKDANTVIYEANLTASQKLNPAKPVDVYWIRYAEKGQREDLSAIQWQMAYGYTHKASAELGAYDISLNSLRSRPLHITRYQGKPVAILQINGKRACLQKVFVQVDPKAHLIPRVQYVEMYGSAVDTGLPVYERIMP